jgi:hypothetical protein
MKLILFERSGTIKTGVPGSGEICGYNVGGLPEGDQAIVAYFNHAWRILRWNEEWHGNWTGSYPTLDAALDGLKEELLSPA